MPTADLAPDTSLRDSAVTPQKTTGRADQAQDWAFGMAAPGFSLFTDGLSRRLPTGPVESLGRRVRDFMAASTEDAPGLLVGALPFDRQADDFLFQPRTVSAAAWPHEDAPRRPMTVRAEPSRAAYKAAVAQALEAIAASRHEARPLDKVVLSRSVVLEAAQPLNPRAVWSALKADPAALRFLTPVGQASDGGLRRLVGATPELLAARTGSEVVSHPLAGSARRSADIVEDEAAAKGLMASDKDRREHALVVEAILDLLAPLCRELAAPLEPALISTRTMWHLGTRIVGTLRDPEATSAAELAALLHPTPAVAGAPRDRAVELIRELEGYDRGFYAGAVGWVDAKGDGAWHVSLRCAEVSGGSARLYAGAGIVDGSEPEAEAEETSGKLLAMLRALGVDEAGRPLTDG